MSIKQDLPNSSTTTNNLTSEMAEYEYLYSLKPRTSTSDISFTSTSSGVTYSTATFNSGQYAGQGQEGLLLILQSILANYLITSADFNGKPDQTMADITYYVDVANGSDSNDGLAAGTGHAFKTIQAAINKLPQVINNTITINLAAGTYPEDVNIIGFLGGGYVFLLGDTIVSTNYTVNSVTVDSCSNFIYIRGINAQTIIQEGFTIRRCQAVRISYCNCITAASYTGILPSFSIVQIDHCTISNRLNGILADYGSSVLSDTNSGTGNTTGLNSMDASTIGKNSTQPGGTTAESSTRGGTIR